MNFQNELADLCSFSGSTNCDNNYVESISLSVEELLVELFSINNLIPDQIISVTFRNLRLKCLFPFIARKKTGWEKTTLDCQQMFVKDSCRSIFDYLLMSLPNERRPKILILVKQKIYVRTDKSRFLPITLYLYHVNALENIQVIIF